MQWLDSILLMWVNRILLIGTVISFVLSVVIFKKSSDRDLPFIFFLIGIGCISSFVIVNYITR
ncbi:putative membrane protein [Bacillus sp. SLBN-46]|uniref:hypothetical protein n=1 Tax=Bacillus sp. SLBN-46 TaxID=3042283 RepID=UPI002859C3DA|nr:hypothetical protein [Bacillus sp. SLBN-46]MDR6121268.1 putative membrane protein [Bacillus sp. SLBN-46]